MVATLLCLASLFSDSSVKLGRVVRADAGHWRVFLEGAKDSRLRPAVLLAAGDSWKSYGTSAIRLPDKTVWEATLPEKGDLQYAFWLQPTPFKKDVSGNVLDADGEHETLTIKPLTAVVADHPIPENPRWASTTTIYRIEIDRFDRDRGGSLGSEGGDRRRGGNLQGILKHVDYLSTLGLGTVLLSPLADSTDAFGRNPIQPLKLNPKFGDASDVKDVVTQIQQNNMHVLAEGPPLGNLPKMDGWITEDSAEGWRVAPERATWDDRKPFQSAVLTDWFSTFREWIRNPDAKATDLEAELQLQRDSLPDALVDLCIHELGDRDAARPSTEFRDIPRLKQAWALLFTYPGIPLLRAGDEIGLAGAAFPENRDPMPWNPGLEDASLQNFIKLLIALRSNRPSLWRGSYEPLVANDELGLFGFVRRDRFQTTLVLVNNSDLTVSYSAAGGRFGDSLSDLIGNGSMGIVNGVLSVNVTPHSFAIIGTP